MNEEREKKEAEKLNTEKPKGPTLNTKRWTENVAKYD